MTNLKSDMICFIAGVVIIAFFLSGCYMLGAPMTLSDIEKRDDMDTYICANIGGPPAGGKVGVVSVPKGKDIPPQWRLPEC